MPVRSARIEIRDRVEAIELAWRGRARVNGCSRRRPKGTPTGPIDVVVLPRHVQDALGHLLVWEETGKPLEARWCEILETYDWPNAPRQGKKNAAREDQERR